MCLARMQCSKDAHKSSQTSFIRNLYTKYMYYIGHTSTVRCTPTSFPNTPHTTQKWNNRTLFSHTLSRKANFSIGSLDNRQLSQKIKYHRFAFLYCGWPTRVRFFHPCAGGRVHTRTNLSSRNFMYVNHRRSVSSTSYM